MALEGFDRVFAGRAERGEAALREAVQLLETLVQEQSARIEYRLALARTLRNLRAYPKTS